MGAQIWDGNAADWQKGKALYFAECVAIALDSIDPEKNDYLMTGQSYEDGAVEAYIREQVIESDWTDISLAEWTFSFTRHLSDAVRPRQLGTDLGQIFGSEHHVHMTAVNAMEADAGDFVDKVIEDMKVKS